MHINDNRELMSRYDVKYLFHVNGHRFNAITITSLCAPRCCREPHRLVTIASKVTCPGPGLFLHGNSAQVCHLHSPAGSGSDVTDSTRLK